MSSTSGSELRRPIVVDDEPALREMIAEYLSKHGFEVLTADGGKALDEHLARGRADLVLLDVNLEPDDGFAIARRLRASQPYLPIIMVTAMGEVVDRVLRLEFGADDYVTKAHRLRDRRHARPRHRPLPRGVRPAGGRRSCRRRSGSSSPCLRIDRAPRTHRGVYC